MWPALSFSHPLLLQDTHEYHRYHRYSFTQPESSTGLKNAPRFYGATQELNLGLARLVAVAIPTGLLSLIY